MTVRIYRSDDTDAPVLTRAPGDFVNLLDAVLVDGYGTKPAAGWSIAYTDTNVHKRVYRNASGVGYFRINDGDHSLASTGGNYCRVFESMSDVDNGINPTPSKLLAQAHDGSDRVVGWLIVADENTAYFISNAYSSGNIFSYTNSYNYTYTNLFMFGAFETYLNSDGFNAFSATFRTTSSSASYSFCRGQDLTGSQSEFYILKNSSRDAYAHAYLKTIDPMYTTNSAYSENGRHGERNPAINGYGTIDLRSDLHSQEQYSSVYISEDITSSEAVLRGKLRGVRTGPFITSTAGTLYDNLAGELITVDGVELVGMSTYAGGFWIETENWSTV